MHCSRYFQVQRVLDAFYTGYEGRLSLLTINPRRLTSPWRFDEVPGEPSTFPHIYGPLNLDAVIETTPVTRDEGGKLQHAWFLPGPDRDHPSGPARRGDTKTGRRTGARLSSRCSADTSADPVATTRPTSRRAEVGSKGCVAVERDGVVVGFLLLGFYRTGDFELSFNFLPEHQGKGYARESASTLAEWVFAVFSHLPRLIAVTQKANERGVSPAPRAELDRGRPVRGVGREPSHVRAGTTPPRQT